MITEKDLQEAIAECEGVKNPNANTCIKLAAFYTIRNHMYPERSEPERGYSYSSAVDYTGDSEFAEAIRGLSTEDVISVLDEAMEALKVLNPPFYASIIRKLNTM